MGCRVRASGDPVPRASSWCIVPMAHSASPRVRRVTPMSSSHVRSSDAYLLFYELASPSSRM